MPNYCENILKIYGEKESLKKIVEEITFVDEDNERKLDFNKIIPQPYLTFEYSINDSIVKSINNYIREENITDEKEIKKIIDDPHWNDESDKFEFIDIEKHDFVDKYDYVSPDTEQKVVGWYDWNNKNWGTKWNALEPNDVELQDNELTILFNTAWNPPVPVMEELIRKYEDSDEYKDIEIDYFYYEPGVGFIGDRYNEYDSDDIDTYASKIIQYGFEEILEYIGITFDEEEGVYRAMTEEEDDYFWENDTLEGFNLNKK